MYIEGVIVDKNGNYITNSGTVQLTVPGQYIPPYPITDGTFSAWTDLPDAALLTFKFNGYKDKKLKFIDVANNDGVVTLESISNITIFALLAVLAAVHLYRQKTGKIGKLTTADLMPLFLLAGGVIGFVLLKQVLEKLGIWESADTKALDAVQDEPNSFWSPNYWQTIKPANKNWTYAITESEAAEWLREIEDSFGMFNDCEECAIAVFKRCRTKANLSFLSWVFSKLGGGDLLTYLRGGWWPQDRLSDADVNIINQYISKLPNY